MSYSVKQSFIIAYRFQSRIVWTGVGHVALSVRDSWNYECGNGICAKSLSLWIHDAAPGCNNIAVYIPGRITWRHHWLQSFVCRCVVYYVMCNYDNVRRNSFTVSLNFLPELTFRDRFSLIILKIQSYTLIMVTSFKFLSHIIPCGVNSTLKWLYCLKHSLSQPNSG